MAALPQTAEAPRAVSLGADAPQPRAAGERRAVTLRTASSVLSLRVPVGLSDPTLYKEIAGQDVLGRKLLDGIDRLDGIVGSNRELFFCSGERLLEVARQFLQVCDELRRLMADLESYRSTIPELEGARRDVHAFFLGGIGQEIEDVEKLRRELLAQIDKGPRLRREELDHFRKKLAKSAGMVRTELQKVFAHLLAHDPRNLYRKDGPRSQQEILFRQFRLDVEITEQLYHAVSRLDRYMRGAIVPSDLLQTIASRVEETGSVAGLFDPDHALFLTALVDEVLEILLPELEEALTYSGIWYDDFENVERRSKTLAELCVAFKAAYHDRHGLRRTFLDAGADDGPMRDALELLDAHGCREMAEMIRAIDQVLVDLEGALLQWQRGVARRAFSREEWGDTEPLQRRAKR